MMRIGPFEVYSIKTGVFRLDGGAMFGVVPKVMWEKSTTPDAANRIPLAARTLLLVDRAAPRVVLVDTGNGTKWDPEVAARYGIEHDGTAIIRALAKLQLTPAEVTDVIVTHLHFDHNGGLSEWVEERGGETRLCFPKARHWIHEKQWKHAHAATPKDRASYLPEDFAALEGSPLLTFVTGDHPAAPFEGVRWLLSHGHSPYQLHPVLGAEKDELIWTGDVIPTIAHLRQAWVMAYDLYPVTTIAEKTDFARRVIASGGVLAFPHDPQHAGVHVDGLPDRPVVARTVELGV